jgi:hypothetical protein
MSAALDGVAQPLVEAAIAVRATAALSSSRIARIQLNESTAVITTVMTAVGVSNALGSD